MDTLYVLCRSVDHRQTAQMDASGVKEACAQKAAYFEAEAKVNPLVKEILAGGRISFEGLARHDKRGFLAGPATFFRTHELLRTTRHFKTRLTIGACEYSHDEVAEMFARCIPNVKLGQLPWCSPRRFRISLGLAWAVTLVVAHITALGTDEEKMLDPFVVYYLGTISTVVALSYTIVTRNRDVRHAAPWNSAIYLDLNADLVRRGSPALAMARKEFVPRQKPLKTPEFYYGLARKIEAHGFDAELLAHGAEATSPVRSIRAGTAPAS